MKNPFFLAFALINVLVISCANKGSENKAEDSLSPSSLKIKTVLDKNFNALLATPTISAPIFTSAEKA